MTEEAPVSELPTSAPDPKEYWHLYPHTLDWQILVTRLVQSKSPIIDKVDPKVAVIGWRMNVTEKQIPIYYLSRQSFTVEEMAKFLGKRPEDLDGIEAIHLRDFKGEDGKTVDLTKWEKPSVDYWGFA